MWELICFVSEVHEPESALLHGGYIYKGQYRVPTTRLIQGDAGCLDYSSANICGIGGRQSRPKSQTNWVAMKTY